MTWKSPLYPVLEASGAQWADEDGILLPLHFGNPALELQALREGWSLLDESHYGRLRITGEDAAQFLHNLTTNDVRSLQPGQGQSTVVTNVKGRILDWSRLYRVGDDFWLITQPSTRESVLKQLDFYHFTEELEFVDISEETALLGLVGPQSGDGLRKLLDWDPMELPLHGHRETRLGGVDCLLIRADRFGHPAFRLWCAPGDVAELARLLLGAGAVFVGGKALEQARVAAGEPGFKTELGEERNPLEAGLHAEVSFDKGCYLGQEVIARLDTYQKVQRFLVLCELGPEASKLEPGTRPDLMLDGKSAGWLSSWSPKPEGDGYWALGYTLKRSQGAESLAVGELPVQVVKTLSTARGFGEE